VVTTLLILLSAEMFAAVKAAAIWLVRNIRVAIICLQVLPILSKFQGLLTTIHFIFDVCKAGFGCLVLHIYVKNYYQKNDK
jgi:hypothetical protein